MNTDTGEIVPLEELERRLNLLPAKDREAERERWVKLQAFEAEMLQKPGMTLAERIAFKSRRNERIALEAALKRDGF